MTGGADYSYGAHFGEYGGTGPYGYGSQPGEYGVDANHGIGRLLQSLEYGQWSGPTAVPPTSPWTTPAAAITQRPRRRTRQLRHRVVVVLLVAAGIVLASPDVAIHHGGVFHQTQPVHAHRR
jgi:hypothetical protein